MFRFFVFSLIAGAIAYVTALRKGRSPVFWGALCVFFPFLLLLLFILPPGLARGVTKQCPHCAEIVRHDASVCRYCGRDFPLDMVKCQNCGKYVPQKSYCMECKRTL